MWFQGMGFGDRRPNTNQKELTTLIERNLHCCTASPTALRLLPEYCDWANLYLTDNLRSLEFRETAFNSFSVLKMQVVVFMVNTCITDQMSSWEASAAATQNILSLLNCINNLTTIGLWRINETKQITILLGPREGFQFCHVRGAYYWLCVKVMGKSIANKKYFLVAGSIILYHGTHQNAAVIQKWGLLDIKVWCCTSPRSDKTKWNIFK